MGANDWWARKLGEPQQPSVQPRPAPPTNYGYAPAPPGAPPPPQAAPVAETGDPYMDAMARAAVATGGSKQVKEESGTCPECGGGNYFDRRRTENGMALRNPAAPHCFDCGYPIIQAGSVHGGATVVKSSGHAARSRQLPKNHAVTVIDGGREVTYQPR